MVKEWATDQGHKAWVLHIDAGYGSWYCGYVQVPKDSPLFGIEYTDDVFNDITVHGGLTFSGHWEVNPEDPTAKKDKETWWLGFDYTHCGDEGATKDQVISECEALAPQIASLEEFLRR